MPCPSADTTMLLPFLPPHTIWILAIPNTPLCIAVFREHSKITEIFLLPVNIANAILAIFAIPLFVPIAFANVAAAI